MPLIAVGPFFSFFFPSFLLAPPPPPFFSTKKTRQKRKTRVAITQSSPAGSAEGPFLSFFPFLFLFLLFLPFFPEEIRVKISIMKNCQRSAFFCFFSPFFSFLPLPSPSFPFFLGKRLKNGLNRLTSAAAGHTFPPSFLSPLLLSSPPLFPPSFARSGTMRKRKGGQNT